MIVDLLAGLVNRFERRAGQFELAAGFERDIAQTMRVAERDDVVALIDARPAEAVAQAFQQGPDGAGPS